MNKDIEITLTPQQWHDVQTALSFYVAQTAKLQYERARQLIEAQLLDH